MKKRWIFAGTVAALAIGTVSLGAAANDVEQPGYVVVKQAENIEIRQYEPMIVAEAMVTGERSRAMNKGFRIIADYIFGNNLSKNEIAMTSPVTQQASEKIAMTSPVTQKANGNEWQVRFIMPSEYTMETLPTPVNPDVELIEIPGKRIATIKFSGRGGVADLAKNTVALRKYLVANEIAEAGTAPTFAFYDGPWVPSPMRRNEVMLELAPE